MKGFGEMNPTPNKKKSDIDLNNIKVQIINKALLFKLCLTENHKKDIFANNFSIKT